MKVKSCKVPVIPPSGQPQYLRLLHTIVALDVLGTVTVVALLVLVVIAR